MKQIDRPKFSDLLNKLKEQSRESKEKFKVLRERRDENNEKFRNNMKKSYSDIEKWREDLKQITNPFGKKCPKCDSKNLNKVKPSLMQKALPGSAFLLFGPIGLLAKQPKTLNVCRDCGFSWEDR